MKFFHINNSVCTQCDRCTDACPTSAIYQSGDRRYINYDRCTSCGNCIGSCNIAGISVRTLEDIVKESEKLEVYRNRIQRLEAELSQTSGKLAEANASVRDIIGSNASPAVICGAAGNIICANPSFYELACADGNENGHGDQNIYSLPAFLEEEAGRLIRGVMPSKTLHTKTGEIDGKKYAVTFIPVATDHTLCCFEDFENAGASPRLVRELIGKVIDSQVDMVRKIGSLLGEESSYQLGELNTALRILNNPADGYERK